MKKSILSLFIVFTIPSFVFAQLEKPVKWSFYAKKLNKSEAMIYLKAKIDGNWHLYAQTINPKAMRLKFSYNVSRDFELIGKTIEPKPIKKYDNNSKIELAYFEKEVVFKQKIKLSKSTTTVNAGVEFMVCNDKQCLPADELSINISIK